MTQKSLIEFSHHHYLPGYLRGRRQPGLIVSLKPSSALLNGLAKPEKSRDLARLANQFNGYCGTVENHENTPSQYDWFALVKQIGICTSSVLQYFKFPQLDNPEILFAPTSDKYLQKPTQLLITIPHCDPSLNLKALKLVLEMISDALIRENFELPITKISDVLSDIKKNLNFSVNALFLKAAYDNEMPVLVLNGGTVQYGFGARSEWFEHTFSMQTTNISVRMARDKTKCSLRLQQAGLPVAPNTKVRSTEEALQFGKHVGFPIVIKPANLDGGTAVTANLSTPNEVRAAVQKVQKVSKQIRAEKHIIGRDYRLTVLDGRVVWAVERVPGGVFGDGENTVEQLIAKENETLNRRQGPAQTLQPLTLNNESMSLLAKQKLSKDTVPTKGTFVRLSSIANVATGGRPVPVFEQVHPDNIKLAERAARALRLDIAGVDILIRDITKSWREVGGVICEVNGQPDLGATTALHLYRDVLRSRVAGTGRIPIIAVVGGAKAAALIKRGVEATSDAVSLGWMSTSAIGIGAAVLQTGKFKSFSGSQILLTDNQVEALIFQVSGEDILQTGLPTDRLDLVIIADEISPPPLHREIEKSLIPACSGDVIRIAGNVGEQTAVDSIMRLFT